MIANVQVHHIFSRPHLDHNIQYTFARSLATYIQHIKLQQALHHASSIFAKLQKNIT